MLKIKSLLFGCCQSDATRNDDQTLTTQSKRTEQNTGPAPTHETQVEKIAKLHPEEDKQIPRLRLTPIEGNVIPIGTEFKITAAGLVEGGRGKKDGITFIGAQKYIISPGLNEQQLFNDILLNDATVGDQHCMIKYDPSLRKYLLKDLGEGSGTFLRIDKEIELKSGYIISFGDSHMAVTVSDVSAVKTKQGSKLSLKFLDGPKTDEIYTFTKDDKTIKVGRMSDCEIRFEGSSLSRYQLTIEYNEDKGWVVVDGFNGKNSTNGTWLYVEGFYEITDGITVKIGQTLFRINLIQDG